MSSCIESSINYNSNNKDGELSKIKYSYRTDFECSTCNLPLKNEHYCEKCKHFYYLCNTCDKWCQYIGSLSKNNKLHKNLLKQQNGKYTTYADYSIIDVDNYESHKWYCDLCEMSICSSLK